MRRTIRRLAAVLLPLILLGCGDLTTSPVVADLPGPAGPMYSSDCYLRSDGVFVCPEQEPVWDSCGEYYMDCGGGDCMTSDAGTGGIDGTTAQGCTGGGGGSGGDDGDGYGGPGGGEHDGDDGGSDPVEPNAYKEGPLLWGACMLAVLGSAYSVDQVADAFVAWWDAQQDYESAKRMYDAVVANYESVSPETIQLWEFRVTYAADQRDAAINAVSEKTNASYWALGAAAVGCGAAAFLPTP
jgi:hypothetical protein